MISSWTDNNWITITFILMLGLLVLAKYLFERRFIKFIKPFESKQYIVSYISVTTVFHPFNVIFLLFQVSCYALLLLKVVKYYNYFIDKNQFVLFLKIGLGIISYYLFRYLLGKIFAFIFGLKTEQEGLSFVKITSLARTAFYIFPFVVILNYFEFKNNLLFLVLASITALVLLIRYLIILKQNQKIIFNKLFYFILYLCILEILPLMLVFNTLTR